MKAFHVVTGLPRSGSTLLCNVLNQNPQFHASSTSVLAQSVAGLSNLWSNSPEIKSDLAHDKTATEARLSRSIKALCESWYADRKGVVFDKSRAWVFHYLALQQVFPEAKIIAVVRDLRAVFASVEKQHQKNPILDYAASPAEKTVFVRADQMFSPDGMIGGPIQGVMDLISRQPPGMIVIQFETFVKSPALIMEKLYAELGEKPHAHDFEAVENTATDLDAIYLHKFPHEGSGKIEPVDDWQTYTPPDIAQQIMQRFPNYNKAFGYT
ncbi:MAG: sulfotransferase family protein [Geminicoccaceae bacterium]